jgi:hypothetical protein
MKKMIMLITAMLLFASSAHGMLQFDDCEASPHFTVKVEPDMIERSVQSISGLSVSMETLMTITPSSEVNMRRIDFGIRPSSGIRIKSIVDQRVTDTNYIIYVTAEFIDNDAKLASVNDNTRIDNIAARIMYQDESGTLSRVNLCIPQLTLKVTGSPTQLPDEADERVQQLRSKVDTADKIKKLLAALNMMFTYTCNQKQGEIDIKLAAFNSNCGGITDELMGIVLEKDGYSIGSKCNSDDTDSPLHPDNCNTCIGLYNEIITLAPDVQSSCQRVKCHDMSALHHFKESYTGDLLGINYCGEEYYNDERCEAQYVASEKPKCLFSDPLILSKAAETPVSGFNLLGLVDNTFCSDRKEPINIIKSPSNDLFSSLSCGCLPGLLGWADIWHDSLKKELDCVLGSSDANLSKCREALYTFGCDMFINALTCGGLNFGVHSESARLLLSSDGDSVNIEGMSPVQIREHINNGYTILASADATFDTGDLIHSVCSSVFGDTAIDWSDVLMNSLDTSGPFVASLCPTGIVRGPCYCGSDLNDPIVNNCGIAPNMNYCDIDADARGECKSSVSIPVPDPMVPDSYDEYPYIDRSFFTPPVDPELLIHESNSDYRYMPSSMQYYYMIPSGAPVSVIECIRVTNGVRISGLFRNINNNAVTRTLMLNNRGLDPSTETIHKFHCYQNGAVASSGDHVVRFEHSPTTGSVLPPEQQSGPETPYVSASNEQITSMADITAERLISYCRRWEHSAVDFNIFLSQLSSLQRIQKQYMASCVKNYPSCSGHTTGQDVEAVVPHLRSAIIRNLGDAEYNRLLDLPRPGESGFTGLSRLDQGLRACVAYV